MLPQTNATLVSVSQPGFSEDFDRPSGGAGAPIVTGPVDAYYRETVVKSYSQSGGALVSNKDVRLIIPADADGADQVTGGMIVVYTYRGVDETRRIQDIVDKFLGGIPNPTMTLHLDPAPVEGMPAGEE